MHMARPGYAGSMPLRDDVPSEHTKLKELGEYIKGAIAASMFNMQDIKDLLEKGIISEEFSERMMAGEKLSVMLDLNNYLDFYRGLN